jgi:DNA-binding cell septation regulator SpoVG
VEITEVRIKLMDEPGERLKAFCSITFDNCFVIRDLKIIEGQTGPFVAMPSRKLTAHCPQCGMKNHLRAQFCNQCGARQAQDRMPLDADGRAKLYADIAHPINSSCREMIQECVVRTPAIIVPRRPIRSAAAARPLRRSHRLRGAKLAPAWTALAPASFLKSERDAQLRHAPLHMRGTAT